MVSNNKTNEKCFHLEYLWNLYIVSMTETTDILSSSACCVLTAIHLQCIHSKHDDIDVRFTEKLLRGMKRQWATELVDIAILS